MDAIGPEVDVMLGGEIALAPARNNARAPLRSTAVSGSVKVPGWESWKTLASVTAYHSFGGEVELRTPHDTPPFLLMPSPTSAHSSRLDDGRSVGRRASIADCRLRGQ